MKIGWIGAGVMGQAMIQHLTKDHDVHVYTRTISKITNTTNITMHNTIKECVTDCDIVFTMVGYPCDVEQVYFEDEGILSNIKDETIVIDMTTSSPALAKKIASSTNCRVLDAPVSGGDTGAKNATLSIMVGGNKEDFDTVLPLLKTLGTNITYVGSHGSGQHCKMCNQIAVAGATAAYSEAIVYATTNGLDVQTVLQAIRKGAAGSWQLDNMAPRVLNEDFDPGFFIKHFVKDMKIVKEEMDQHHTSLEMLNCVLSMYEVLEKNGLQDAGTQALIKYYKNESSN